MADIEWPEDLVPSRFGIKLRSNKKEFTSPFNGSTQDAYFPGSYWVLTLAFQNLDDDESRELESVLHTLNTGGRVKIPDFGRLGVNYSGVKVLGNAQTGGVLVTQGWPVNALVLKKGSYISVGDELKILRQDAYSTAAGQATLQVAPWLRGSYQTGQVVEVRRPCGYFKLDDQEVGPDREAGDVNNFQLKMKESFY